MSAQNKYSFWIDRKVDGYVYRFSEFAIKRHPGAGPEHWDVFQEFEDPRDCARAWRKICDQAEKEKTHAAV